MEACVFNRFNLFYLAAENYFKIKAGIWWLEMKWQFHLSHHKFNDRAFPFIVFIRQLKCECKRSAEGLLTGATWPRESITTFERSQPGGFGTYVKYPKVLTQTATNKERGVLHMVKRYRDHSYCTSTSSSIAQCSDCSQVYLACLTP